jgi:amino acid adenylation domain-containing protein
MVYSAFAAVAGKFGANTAIEEEGRCISYAKLHSDIDVLSNVLRELGVKKDVIVGVAIDPSINLVTSMMSVFRSGGIYLPIDLDFSTKRLRQIFANTFHGILVVSDQVYAKAQEVMTELKVDVDRLVVMGPDTLKVLQYNGAEFIETVVDSNKYSHKPIDWHVSPDDANYIFYTSGSTGDGKAVLGCHKSLSHYVSWGITEFELDNTFRHSHLSKATFDASLQDILFCLCSGGTLCIPSKATKENFFKLIGWIEDAEISVMFCIPSIFRMLMKNLKLLGTHEYDLRHLRMIFLAGERLYSKDISSWQSLVGTDVELINLYGTTETTVLDTFHRITECPEDPSEIMHVGHPISDTHIIIVNNNKLCRIGEVGDIYIKSPFQTLGYYGNPTLTSEVFVQNPLVSDRTDIVYKSGDIGRYRRDRSVVVLGRKDKQIKVNGVRIEVGEIERAVIGVKGVNDVYLKTFENADGIMDLVCYYCSEVVVPEELKGKLKEILNPDIIPGYFVQRINFPLNSNGKVAVEEFHFPENTWYRDHLEEPLSPVEEGLNEIFSEVLSAKKGGKDTSFFMQGGNSLKAVQLISKVYKKFGVDLKITDIFRNPTIRTLAAFVSQATDREAKENIHAEEISRLPKSSYYDMSPAQSRLWIIDQLRLEVPLYNLVSSFEIHGDIDIEILERTLEYIINRHESLRTTFVSVNGEPKQKVKDFQHLQFKLQVVEIRSTEEQKTFIANRTAAENGFVFDLENGPLFRCTLIKTGDKEFVIIFNMHHIISDAWSIELLFNEMLVAYDALAKNLAVPLPELKVHYKDYSHWLNKCIVNKKLDAQLHYWQKKYVEKIVNKPDFATDYPRPEEHNYDSGCVKGKVDQHVFEQLKALSVEKKTSLYALVLTAIKILIYRYTNNNRVVIGGVVSGRDHPGVEGLIGFFINSLVYVTDIEGHDSYEDVLNRVKKEVMDSLENQVYPFDQWIDKVGYVRERNRAPIYDLEVVYYALRKQMGLDKEQYPFAIKEHQEHVTSTLYDMSFRIIEGDDLSFRIVYNRDLFSESTVELFKSKILAILDVIIDDPGVPVNKIRLFDESVAHADEELVNAKLNL